MIPCTIYLHDTLHHISYMIPCTIYLHDTPHHISYMSSKNTNIPPPIYIKYICFISIFSIFLELGRNIPTTSTFGGFQIFSPETLNFVIFCYTSKINNFLLLLYFTFISPSCSYSSIFFLFLHIVPISLFFPYFFVLE